MSDKIKAIDHGEIIPQPPARPKPLQIPRVFHNKFIVGPLERSKAIKDFGLWKMRCIQGSTVAGVPINPGDTFICPGNEAVSLALTRTAEFIDEKVLRESELMQEVEALGLNKAPDPRAMEQFQQPRRSWVKPEAA